MIMQQTTIFIFFAEWLKNLRLDLRCGWTETRLQSSLADEVSTAVMEV